MHYLSKIFQIIGSWRTGILLTAALATILIAVITVLEPFSDDDSPPSASPALQSDVASATSSLGTPLAFTPIGSSAPLANVVDGATPAPFGSGAELEVNEQTGAADLTCVWLDRPSLERLLDSEALVTDSYPVPTYSFPVPGGASASQMDITFDVSSIATQETTVIERLTVEVNDFASISDVTPVNARGCGRGGGGGPAPAILPEPYEGVLEPGTESDLVPTEADVQSLYVLAPHEVRPFYVGLTATTEGRYSFQIHVYYHTSSGQRGRLSSDPYRLTYSAEVDEAELYPHR